MPTFSSSAELKSYILSRSYTAVYNTIDNAHKSLENSVNNFYSQEPEYYLRTDRLRGSLTNPIVTGGGSSVVGEVYFDEGKLDYPQGFVALKKPFSDGTYEGYANYANLGGSMGILDAAMTGDSGNLKWTNNTAIWNQSLPYINRKQLGKNLKKNLKAAGIPIK